MAHFPNLTSSSRSSFNRSFTVDDLDHHITSGPYAWPGGYPLYFITSDCSVLSWDALVANRDLIAREIECSMPSGEWDVVGFQINWEDPALFCDVTGERIESAYAEELDLS